MIEGEAVARDREPLGAHHEGREAAPDSDQVEQHQVTAAASRSAREEILAEGQRRGLGERGVHRIMRHLPGHFAEEALEIGRRRV